MSVSSSVSTAPRGAVGAAFAGAALVVLALGLAAPAVARAQGHRVAIGVLDGRNAPAARRVIGGLLEDRGMTVVLADVAPTDDATSAALARDEAADAVITGSAASRGQAWRVDLSVRDRIGTLRLNVRRRVRGRRGVNRLAVQLAEAIEALPAQAAAAGGAARLETSPTATEPPDSPFAAEPEVPVQGEPAAAEAPSEPPARPVAPGVGRGPSEDRPGRAAEAGGAQPSAEPGAPADAPEAATRAAPRAAQRESRDPRPPTDSTAPRVPVVRAWAQAGGGVRARRVVILTPDGNDAGYLAEPFAELAVRAGVQILEVAFARAEFGSSLLLESERESPGLPPVETWFTRLSGDVGATANIDDVVEIGGAFGVFWDRYQLRFNELVPTAEYLGVRPALLSRFRLVGRALMLDAEFGARVPLTVGDLEALFGTDHDAFGLDGVGRVHGVIDPGFLWALEVGFRQYWLSFGQGADRVQARDGGWRATAFVGWELSD